ncbi:MAG TPA: hydrogenase formation protein HypD [Phycisphaerae bacterium]|nr:hydrogenase formation protein HypD [Phycisphaerae bacterium]
MDKRKVRQLVGAIAEAAGRVERVRLMEICGTHTVSLFRSGVKGMLPANVRLISGPGCPVCVTSSAYLDAARELAGRDNVTICTYGDMVRVPGRAGSLEHARGQGADVRVVYSARDAVGVAREQPERDVVFLAVGFETTTPATAAAVMEADRAGLTNFFVLPGHKLVLPAIEALLAAGEVPIDGFLCPGHVSVILGAAAYRPIAEARGKPCVVAGFEPVNMLEGLAALARQVAEGRSAVENVYGVAVTEEGNAVARRMIAEAFEPAAAVWRAMGTIPASGLELRGKYRRFDARQRFGVEFGEDYEPAGCLCGQVVQGKVAPAACPLFGKACTPLAPVGPCMVSSEGTCAAWYKYGRPAGSSSAGTNAEGRG